MAHVHLSDCNGKVHGDLPAGEGCRPSVLHASHLLSPHHLRLWHVAFRLFPHLARLRTSVLSGTDFLFAHGGEEMTETLNHVFQHPEISESLVSHRLQTIRERHTCGHRVDQLLTFMESLASVTVSQGAK